MSECHRDVGNLSVTVLGDDNLCLSYILRVVGYVLVVGPVDENHHVGILLD